LTDPFTGIHVKLEQTFRIRTGESEMPDVLNGVEEFCCALGLATAPSLEVRLVAEEVLTNVVKYAHALTEERVVELRLSGSPESVRLEFRDEGMPFNLLDAPQPDLAGAAENRPTGGLGVHLVKALIDDASYAREGAVNVLVLIKHVGSTV
jgi:anti-sigma regulatory factor (Ser/Thr protein kinase)